MTSIQSRISFPTTCPRTPINYGNMFFDLSKIGEWLGKKLSPNLEELTDEELQKLRKEDLILIVKELQYKNKTITRQKKQLQDKVYDLFIKL